ncbi:MAG TPA: TonB-dependent receptor [Chitinophagaceae bacterium]|nr:TonB-dependent receptor [Chitinophagaceae bacterium]
MIIRADRFFAFLLFCFLDFISFGQSANISGKVKDQQGTPLIYANIVIKNTAVGTITDEYGAFNITAKLGDTLVVSYLGHSTEEWVLFSNSDNTIILKTNILNLNELVITTGYTTQKVKEVTGSIAIVNPQDLNSMPAGQVEQMLQGRVAGLDVITSGMPGSGSNVRIHGIGNFGDVTPLYIIDGVQGNINSINSQDIESIQVLKDAGAFAIYGVRGANGVIIITTKKGQAGRTKVSYDFYLGTQRPLKGPDLLDPQEMAGLTWLAYKNSGILGPNGNPNDLFYGNGPSPVLPDYLVAGPWLGTNITPERANPDLYNIDFTNGPIYQIIRANKTGTDWFHEIFKPAMNQNHTITASGGGENNKFLFSLNYLDQKGTLLNTYLKRFTARINSSMTLNKKIRIGENLQISSKNNLKVATQKGPNNNEIFRALIGPPILPVYDIKGGWASFRTDWLIDNSISFRTVAKDDKAKSWEIFGNTWAEAEVLKNFTAKTQFGGTFSNYYAHNFGLVRYIPLNNLPNNFLSESSGYATSWTWINTLHFSKLIHQHSIKLLMGTEAISNYRRETGGKRIGLFSNDPNYRLLTNGIPANPPNYSLAQSSTLSSFISRFDYAYRNRYFISGTLRNDGSSVFGPQNRFGWFPSVSAAWIMTEEQSFIGSTWLTDLKWRASWGKTGFYGNTDPLNQYFLYGGSVGNAYYDIFGVSTGAIQQGFRATRLGEPKTGWQEDVVINAGFEGRLWKGKLSITADWYKKKSTGLLFPLTLPDVLGGATPPNGNVGNVQNTGLDVLVGSQGKWSRDWSWDINMTLTTYKNKIIKLNDLPFFNAPGEQGGPWVRNEVGHPVSSFYGLKVIGYFQNAEEVNNSPKQQHAAPGRFKYQDANGDGTITDMDRVHFGHANPEFTAGVNTRINYKNFDFSTFFYVSYGNEVINLFRGLTNIFSSYPGLVNSAKSKIALYGSWTPQRPNAQAPVAETSINYSNIGGPTTSYWSEDGSYFRNKIMTLGYSLPRNILSKIKIEQARIYLQAINLFTWTKYSGLDPELSGHSAAFGIDFGNYPNNQKQYLLGMNINF